MIGIQGPNPLATLDPPFDAGLGLGSIWTPAALGNALVWWAEAVSGYVYSDTAYTTPATANGTLGSLRDRRGPSKPGVAFSGGTATWTGTAAKFDGAVVGTLSSLLAMGGAASVYAVGTRAAASNYVVLSRNSGASGLWIDNLSNLQIVSPSGNVTVPSFSPSGYFLLRVRIDGLTQAWAAATGIADSMVGTAGGFGFNTLGKEFTVPTLMAANNQIAAVLCFNTDTVANGTDGQILAYIKQNFGVTL
jgi:hypothetical protein